MIGLTDGRQLYPDPQVSKIDILYRHLYRDPNDEDAKTPAFSFKTSDIMSVIMRQEGVQNVRDNVGKRQLQHELELLSRKKARKTKRQEKP
jgi:hypothetical protein